VSLCDPYSRNGSLAWVERLHSQAAVLTIIHACFWKRMDRVFVCCFDACERLFISSRSKQDVVGPCIIEFVDNMSTIPHRFSAATGTTTRPLWAEAALCYEVPWTAHEAGAPLAL